MKKKAEKFLNTALGGNMNIATLKPLALIEIMTAFAEIEVAAINYTRCSLELNTSFKKGDKVIASNKLEGIVVSSETRTMVKVKIKGTTVGINARSLELKSI